MIKLTIKLLNLFPDFSFVSLRLVYFNPDYASEGIVRMIIFIMNAMYVYVNKVIKKRMPSSCSFLG